MDFYKLRDSTVTIPSGVEVEVDLTNAAGCRVQRQYLTCFRCGENFHYKSECGSFRTRMCSKWERGVCDDEFCSFAHGEAFLRTPWVPKCIRIVKVNGRIQRLGCGVFGHTYRSCPHHGTQQSNDST